jgi:hypothetical protein
MAYVAGLLVDFDRYLAAGTPDPVRDGADYRMAAMWLTDTEFADFLRDFRTVFQPRLANAPGNDRRRRMVYSVFLPAPEKPPVTTRREFVAAGREHEAKGTHDAFNDGGDKPA